MGAIGLNVMLSEKGQANREDKWFENVGEVEEQVLGEMSLQQKPKLRRQLSPNHLLVCVALC